MKNATKILPVLIFPLAILKASAAPYAINWYKIAGGGGTSGGANGSKIYSVSGAIGQPEAGNAVTGGNYSLTGGFWSMVSVVQTVNSPVLTVTHAARTVTISWPASPGFTLQQNSHLWNSNWVNSAFAVGANGQVESVTISNTTGSLFFRLVAPIAP